MSITKAARIHEANLKTERATYKGGENMPRTYLTMAERQDAEREAFNRKQDNNLRIELLTAKKTQRLTYRELAEKASVGVSTVQRILDVSFDLGKVELDKLRSVCGALGVRLMMCTE